MQTAIIASLLISSILAAVVTTVTAFILLVSPPSGPGGCGADDQLLCDSSNAGPALPLAHWKSALRPNPGMEPDALTLRWQAGAAKRARGCRLSRPR